MAGIKSRVSKRPRVSAFRAIIVQVVLDNIFERANISVANFGKVRFDVVIKINLYIGVL